MACYESTFIIRQDVSAQIVSEITNQFIEIIEKFGGVLIKKEYWGLRSLAYIIKKNRKGHYIMLGIKSSKSDLVKNLERMYNINENVIRHLTVKVGKIDNEPSIMMRAPREVEIAQ